MNFDKKDISFEGTSNEVWVMYKPFGGKDRRFIARFKYASPKRNANAFVKFIVENFTVEEYFEAYDNNGAPLRILEAKGYVSPNKKRALAA